MPSRRSRVLLLGTLFTLIVGLIPLGLSVFWSYRSALQIEEQKIDLLAQQAVEHSTSIFDEVRQVLVDLSKLSLPVCSPEMMARMRSLTVVSDVIEDIAYFEGTRQKCTSWRLGPRAIKRPDSSYKTAEGDIITLNYRPTPSFQKDMIGIWTGPFEALMLPTRLLNFTVIESVAVVLLNNQGTVISERNATQDQLSVAKHRLAHDGVGKGWLSGIARKDDLVAVALENRSVIWPQFRENLEQSLPIGFMFSLLVIGLSVRYWRNRLSKRMELELAIRNHEFIVFYQPIIRLHDGICVGAEALVRWKQPNGEIIAPDSFIPLAEETGLIEKITDQVIDHVIQDLNHILVNDRSLHVTINLTPEDIETGRALKTLDALLLYSGIEKRQIWLEVTERSFINAEIARETLMVARNAGYIIALDDFGTGYSSLQHLQGLPLDALKIDRSFVSKCKEPSTSGSLTQHIVNIARDHRLFSVAEGIETGQQLEALRLMGVEFGQGWLFAKPLPIEQFLMFLATCKASRTS